MTDCALNPQQVKKEESRRVKRGERYIFEMKSLVKNMVKLLTAAHFVRSPRISNFVP